MPDKTIQIVSAALAGASGLSLLVFAEGGDVILNGGGDAATHSAYGRFQATVAEPLAGWYEAALASGSTLVTERGKLYVPADLAGTYTVDSKAAEALAAFNSAYFPPLVMPVDDVNPVFFYWPAPSLSLSGQRSLNGAAFAPLAGLISYSAVQPIPGRYRYQIAPNAADRAVGRAVYVISAGGSSGALAIEFLPAAAVTVSPDAVAAGVYRRLSSTGAVGLVDRPTTGSPLDVIHSADFSYSCDLATDADSELVFSIRRDVADSSPALEIVNGAITSILGAAANEAAADGLVERVSAETVRVKIAARALSLLAPGQYVAEIRELSAADETLSRHEVEMVLRRSASRRLA